MKVIKTCPVTDQQCNCVGRCAINHNFTPVWVKNELPQPETVMVRHLDGQDTVEGVLLAAEKIAKFNAETLREMEKNIAIPAFGENTKVSTGKARVDLLPPSVLLEVARVMDYGASVHGENNWQNGVPWMKYYAAAMRHLLKFGAGEDMDLGKGGTGESHLACSIADLMILLYYFQNREHYRSFDNRFFNKENKQ